MPENTFNKAVSNFTFDIANGDLICKLAKQGYSVARIKNECDYPVSEEKIRETVWDYYIESGIVVLEDPDTIYNKHTEYVMDIGEYGRRSFRQIQTDTEKKNYVKCDFGVIKARSEDEYKERLSHLDKRKREYIEGLPWPDTIIYHEDNLMIREILQAWNEKSDMQ